MFLAESAMALSILTVLGLLLLKLALNILLPRQWAVQQSITDAYLTYERAAAERIPFETLLGASSPWPAFPDIAAETTVLGNLPGGYPVSGTIHRFRIEDPGNVPIADEEDREAALVYNPAKITTWKVQSVLSYTIGEKNYTKSRTILRSQ
ncbi:MAG: hypothetical protein V4733_04945 [Verrucomicrobiota bacterium]